MTKPDPYSLHPYLLLDADVVRDVADALDGRWRPADEDDRDRRYRLLSAARLRMYSDSDRSGWHLASYREAIEAGLGQGDANWSVGFIADVMSFEDSPTHDDLEPLIKMYSQSGLQPEERRALAVAVLYEPVAFLVTHHPRRYKHGRDHDLPERLRVISVGEAVDALQLLPGESPVLTPPADTALAEMEPWWIPKAD